MTFVITSPTSPKILKATANAVGLFHFYLLDLRNASPDIAIKFRTEVSDHFLVAIISWLDDVVGRRKSNPSWWCLTTADWPGSALLVDEILTEHSEALKNDNPTKIFILHAFSFKPSFCLHFKCNTMFQILWLRPRSQGGRQNIAKKKTKRASDRKMKMTFHFTDIFHFEKNEVGMQKTILQAKRHSRASTNKRTQKEFGESSESYRTPSVLDFLCILLGKIYI